MRTCCGTILRAKLHQLTEIRANLKHQGTPPFVATATRMIWGGCNPLNPPPLDPPLLTKVWVFKVSVWILLKVYLGRNMTDVQLQELRCRIPIVSMHIIFIYTVTHVHMYVATCKCRCNHRSHWLHDLILSEPKVSSIDRVATTLKLGSTDFLRQEGETQN